MHLSPFWQQFKNSITLKIHSTSTSSVTSQQTAWFIKISPSTSCSVCISPCCARLTGVIISVGVHVTTVKFSATFYDTVQSHSIITTRMHQLAINFDVWMLAMLPTGHKRWHCYFTYLYVAFFMNYSQPICMLTNCWIHRLYANTQYFFLLSFRMNSNYFSKWRWPIGLH